MGWSLGPLFIASTSGEKISIMRLTFCYLHIAPYHHAQLNALAESGVKVTAISFEDFAGAAFNEKATDQNKYSISVLSNSSETWDELYQVLSDSRPDVVLVPGWGHAYALATLKWVIYNHIPCVAISDSQECDHLRKFLMESLKSRVVRLFSAAFVAGKRSAAYIAKLGMPVDRITSGCDVVDNDYFINNVNLCREQPEQVRTLLALPVKYFLVVSRLVDFKNISTVINAYAMYRKNSSRNNCFSLVIIGEGPLQMQLQQLALELGVADSVVFVGSVNYADICKYYALASAFVLASYSEPWGLVVNEAMCAGLPILVSVSCGSSVDLVKENVNGLCFDPDDERMLATSMGSITSSQKVAIEMGEASRQLISEWSLESYVKGIRRASEIANDAPQKSLNLLDSLLLSSVIKRLRIGDQKL